MVLAGEDDGMKRFDANQPMGDLFRTILHIGPNWRVDRIEEDEYPLPGPNEPDPLSRWEGRLDIYLTAVDGPLPCGKCGTPSPRRDRRPERLWTDYPLGGYRLIVHAQVPRVDCDTHGVVSTEVPWAREHSTFTWRLEFRALALCRLLSVTDVAELVGVTDHRIHRMLGYHASRVRQSVSMAGVTRVGVDETAAKRGQNYITLFIDLDSHRVLFAAPGRGHETVLAFRAQMVRQGGDPTAVVEFSQDMSEAFRKGVEMAFPNAAIAYDKFHIVKAMNEAVDKVRREEQRDCEELKKTRWLWLHNLRALATSQQERLGELLHSHLKTGRAYELRVQLQEFYEQPTDLKEPYLRRWFWRASHSRLEAVADVAWMIKNHWAGVLNGALTGTTNAILEGTNSLLQRARSRARGYRNVENLINMLFFLAYPIDRRLCTRSIG